MPHPSSGIFLSPLCLFRNLLVSYFTKNYRKSLCNFKYYCTSTCGNRICLLNFVLDFYYIFNIVKTFKFIKLGTRKIPSRIQLQHLPSNFNYKFKTLKTLHLTTLRKSIYFILNMHQAKKNTNKCKPNYFIF